MKRERVDAISPTLPVLAGHDDDVRGGGRGGAALFAKVRAHADVASIAGLKTDLPMLLLLAIVLTAVALGSWKEHSLNQILLQGALACIGALTLIQMSEAGLERTVRYWFQGAFALGVVVPMMVRRYVKENLPRGPQRDWWKKTCEAVFFSFFGVLLVTGGAVLQLLVLTLYYSVLRIPGP